MEILAFFFNKISKKCVNPGHSSTRHESWQQHQIKAPPEVLTFNLCWNEDPAPTDILRTLVTIPESFFINELYTQNVETDAACQYIFKGMTCFQDGHYLSYFRRVFMKYDFIATDYRNV